MLCSPSLLFSLLPLLAASDTLTLHQVAETRSVTGAQMSPDAKRIAYTVSVPRKPLVDDDGAPWTELWVVDLPAGLPRAFVSGKQDLSGVSWTPDSSAIAFLAKRGEDKHNSLYVLPIDGGEARRVSSLATAITAYSFSPDGSEVALVASTPEDEGRKKESDKGFKQEIYEEDWRANQVWIASLADSAPAPRALTLEGHVTQCKWSPVDGRLLVARAPTPLVDDEMMRQRVSIVDSQDGSVLARFENPGKLGPLAWSPDGARIAVQSANDIHDPSAGRLLIAPSAGGALVDPLPSYPGDIAAYAWLDAKSVMVVAARGVWTALVKVDLGGASAPKTLVAEGGPILTSLSLSKGGQHAAFVANSPAHPPELFTMSHGEAAPRRLSESNPWLSSVTLGAQELVKFKARDGLDLEGVLVRPIGEVAGQRYPLVLYVHGGPEAHHSNGWLTSYGDPVQVLAAEGYAVFHTNYRGSTGRGVAFSKLSQGDPAGKEFDDLIDAVDHLIAIGLVDRDKVTVTGGSYGGYATAWLSTRYSDRFAAGVMFVGISDKISKVGTTDIPDEEFYVHALKRPWDDWKFMLERSPIFHADKCKTPLLILHGKDDPRVNPGQSRELFRHLKVHGKSPVRLVFYPGEGHGNRKAAARLDYSMRLVQWMNHYVRGPAGAPPPFDLDYAQVEESKGP